MKKTILTFYELTWQEKAALQYEAMREQFSEEKDAAAAVPAETSPQKPSLVVNFPKAAPQPLVPPVPRGVWTDDEAEIGTAPAKQPSSSAPAAKPSVSAPTASEKAIVKPSQAASAAKASVPVQPSQPKVKSAGTVSAHHTPAVAPSSSSKPAKDGINSNLSCGVIALLTVILIAVANIFEINGGVISILIFGGINLLALSCWFKNKFVTIAADILFFTFIVVYLIALKDSNYIKFEEPYETLCMAATLFPMVAIFVGSFFKKKGDAAVLKARVIFSVAWIISAAMYTSSLGEITNKSLRIMALIGFFYWIKSA